MANDSPVVVLLRNPTDLIESYKRAVRFAPPKTKALWDTLDQGKIRKEAKAFYDAYMKLKKHPRFLVITYDELVKNTTKTIHAVLNHLGVKYNTKAIIKLAKKRFKGRKL